MNIYNYSAITREFVSIGLAKPDPQDPGRWLIPANATTVAPPETGENQAALFDGSAWALSDDFRGIAAWDTTTAGPVAIDAIGPLPIGVTLLDPAGIQVPIWDGAAWVNDDAAELAAAKEAKIQEIKEAYQDAEDTATITVSDTTYRADRDFLAEVDLERRLAEANGETEIIVFDVALNPHTVGLAGVDATMQLIRVQTRANYEHGMDLTRQVNQATTVAGVEAIGW